MLRTLSGQRCEDPFALEVQPLLSPSGVCYMVLVQENGPTAIAALLATYGLSCEVLAPGSCHTSFPFKALLCAAAGSSKYQSKERAADGCAHHARKPMRLHCVLEMISHYIPTHKQRTNIIMKTTCGSVTGRRTAAQSTPARVAAVQQPTVSRGHQFLQHPSVCRQSWTT
jgi:hypothetical protein